MVVTTPSMGASYDHWGFSLQYYSYRETTNSQPHLSCRRSHRRFRPPFSIDGSHASKQTSQEQKKALQTARWETS